MNTLSFVLQRTPFFVQLIADGNFLINAIVKALETRIKSLYAPIVEEMGTACKGTCEQGGECFKVSYNPLYREGISKDRLSALRAQYPDIYDEFVDQTESRIFKVVKSAIA